MRTKGTTNKAVPFYFTEYGEVMANEENLKPFTSNQSHEEAVKNGRKGGKASGAARRRRASIKKRLKEALDMDVTSKSFKKLVRMMGMNPDDCTNYDALVASLLLKAIALHDTTAIQMIMDYTGKSPGEKRKAEEAKRKREIYAYQKKKLEQEENGTEEKDDDRFLEARRRSNPIRKNALHVFVVYHVGDGEFQ